MKNSIYVIQPTPERHNALFCGTDKTIAFKLSGAGVVKEPMEFNNSKTENKFKCNQIVLIVKGVRKSDIKKYPWMFSKGEFSRVNVKTGAVFDFDKSVIVPGIKYISILEYLYYAEKKLGQLANSSITNPFRLFENQTADDNEMDTLSY